MSAMQPSGALISIGGAVLYTVGLNPQRLSYSSEARFPAHAVQGGMRYQVTGAGDQRMTIEAVTYPHVVGGLDAVAILKGLHRAQLMAPMTRLRGNYLGLADGLCVIETMDYDEERLHPVDGIGREVSVSLGLLFIPPSIYLQSTGRIASLEGLLG